MKTNILLISLYYPPINSIASNRIAAICKYLDPESFDIDVVTLLSDDAQPYENNKNIRIFRVKDTSFFRPFRFLTRTNKVLHNAKALWNILLQNIFPEYDGWKKNVLKTIASLQNDKHYDIIFSSYGPSAPHEIALKIKKTSDAKWIADMRDEMSLNPFLSPRKRKKLAQIEQLIFDNCDMITSVSKPILEDFKTLARDKAEHIRFLEIRNGYDFPLRTHDSFRNDLFTISHIGSFYGERNPSNFLSALSLLHKKALLPSIRVNFIGISKPISIPDNLRSVVNVSSSVTHYDALNAMEQSDALLLIHPTTGNKGIYTGKLFEYLGMKKPILALIDPNDVAADLINHTNAGYSGDNSDIETIQQNLLRLYHEWEANTPRYFNIELIQKHHRKEQIGRLENSIIKLLHE